MTSASYQGTIEAASPPSLGGLPAYFDRFGVSGVSRLFEDRAIGYRGVQEQAASSWDLETYHEAAAASRRNAFAAYLTDPVNVALRAATLGEGLAMRAGAGLATRGIAGGADDAVDLFRFVSRAELDDLAATGGKSRPGPNSLDAKQFGLNLGEVETLSTRLGGADAILRARVPRSTLNALDRTPLDPSILRSGAASAQPGSQLDLLNRTLIELERVR